MFKVYQIQLTEEEIALLNREGWGVDNARIRAYGRRSFDFNPTDFEHYDLVAHVGSNDPEEVFMLMNMWDDERKIQRMHENVSSLSVGDILVHDDGTRYVCANFGFNKF